MWDACRIIEIPYVLHTLFPYGRLVSQRFLNYVETSKRILVRTEHTLCAFVRLRKTYPSHTAPAEVGAPSLFHVAAQTTSYFLTS